MAGSLNRVTLIGNLAADPEIKSMQSGKNFARFRMATTESWSDRQSGERKEETEWHSIVVWNEGLVDNVVAKYLYKGSKVYIEGALKTRKWQDQSGADRYSTEVVLKGYSAQIILLDGKDRSRDVGEERAPRGKPAPASQRSLREDIDDEIPF